TKKPPFFVLKNIKNLKNHNKNHTFTIIMATLNKLNYNITNATNNPSPNAKIVNTHHFLPQHHKRIILIKIQHNTGLNKSFSL
ncbi:DNA (cytosine-5-)-methyltransferase, partial [Bacillus sp. MBGLi97]